MWGPHVQIHLRHPSAKPDVDSPIEAAEQMIAGEFGLIAGELGRFWFVLTRLRGASQYFSQQLSPDYTFVGFKPPIMMPDYNVGTFAPEISASSPSESSLR